MLAKILGAALTAKCPLTAYSAITSSASEFCRMLGKAPPRNAGSQRTSCAPAPVNTLAEPIKPAPQQSTCASGLTRVARMRVGGNADSAAPATSWCCPCSAVLLHAPRQSPWRFALYLRGDAFTVATQLGRWHLPAVTDSPARRVSCYRPRYGNRSSWLYGRPGSRTH